MFKRSLLGYRRSDVEEALRARDLALGQLRENLAATEARLAEAQATSELRERSLEDLEKVATLLAERVVKRERELRAAIAAAAQDAPGDDEAVPAPLPKTASGS